MPTVLRNSKACCNQGHPLIITATNKPANNNVSTANSLLITRREWCEALSDHKTRLVLWSRYGQPSTLTGIKFTACCCRNNCSPRFGLWQVEHETLKVKFLADHGFVFIPRKDWHDGLIKAPKAKFAVSSFSRLLIAPARYSYPPTSASA